MARGERERERLEERAVLERLQRHARLLADRFSLPLRSVDAESTRVKRRYGICYDDGRIKIRLRHATTRRLLKYSALVDTLCHELAHLRHFDHGWRFQAFYQRILSYARRNGIYRPAPRDRYASREPLAPEHRLLPTLGARAPRPVQLQLFPAPDRRCGGRVPQHSRRQ